MRGTRFLGRGGRDGEKSGTSVEEGMQVMTTCEISRSVSLRVPVFLALIVSLSATIVFRFWLRLHSRMHRS